MRIILSVIATVVALFTVAVTGLAAAADAPPVPYPKDCRDWHHIKSMVISPGHALYDSFGGIHHLYANKVALQGYITGKWPDGAVIVFDLLDAKVADNAVTEGARKVVGVMHRVRGNMRQPVAGAMKDSRATVRAIARWAPARRPRVTIATLRKRMRATYSARCGRDPIVRACGGAAALRFAMVQYRSRNHAG